MDVVTDLPADAQPPEPVQQGETLLNHPAVHAQPGAVLGAAARDDWGDPGGPDLLAVFVVVIAAVRVDLVRALAGPAAAAAYRRDGLDQGHELGDVVADAAGQRDRQRDPVRYSFSQGGYRQRPANGSCAQHRLSICLREVAALIPGATLIPLPGSSHLFYHGDWLAVLDAVLGFLCEPASPGPRLTGRELEVAELVAEGLTNQVIARRLSVAPRTAEAHMENIRRKLQVHSRAQIAAWVTEHRLRS